MLPGQRITQDSVLIDVGDGMVDITMLFDDSRWSLTLVTLGTHQ